MRLSLSAIIFESILIVTHKWHFFSKACQNMTVMKIDSHVSLSAKPLSKIENKE